MRPENSHKPRFPYSPFPDGWFVVGFSDELARGEVKRVTYHGRNLVLWRTSAGRAYLSDAYCPHMGAHLGYGGTVQGETLQCPFHHFRFAGDGSCVATPYDGKLPHRARLPMVALDEKHGMLFAGFAADGATPDWRIPELPTEGWTAYTHEMWTLTTHPQETTENSVDLGHLPVVHGYSSVDILGPVETHGAHLTIRYGMTRKGIPGITPQIRAEFTIHAHGLGYSLVEVEVRDLGIRSRNFVLVSPIDGDRCHLRGAVSVHRDLDATRVHRLLGFAPKDFALWFVRRIVFDNFASDMKQDFDIWQTKRYIDPPALAAGDGPVGIYRRWCRQFYPEHRAPADAIKSDDALVAAPVQMAEAP